VALPLDQTPYMQRGGAAQSDAGHLPGQIVVFVKSQIISW
jgi:hypothetical protein